MKIIEKIISKENAPLKHEAPTIAFLGDSVTYGCFEVFVDKDGEIETVYDRTSSFSSFISEMFSLVCPKAALNIINAGISGDNAESGYRRLKRDIIRFKPDLTVVCYGLNDCEKGLDGLKNYTSSLEKIFVELKERGSEVIFLTPNMMCTYADIRITDKIIKETAETVCELQNNGVLEKYLEAAVKIAKKHDITVCDMYDKWKRMYSSGIDTTRLLVNNINHPVKEMQKLCAYKLIETMFER